MLPARSVDGWSYPANHRILIALLNLPQLREKYFYNNTEHNAEDFKRLYFLRWAKTENTIKQDFWVTIHPCLEYEEPSDPGNKDEQDIEEGPSSRLSRQTRSNGAKGKDQIPSQSQVKLLRL